MGSNNHNKNQSNLFGTDFFRNIALVFHWIIKALGWILISAFVVIVLVVKFLTMLVKDAEKSNRRRI